MSKADENEFPNLRRTRYRVASPRTGRYNCIAHAAGDQNRKWDSAPGYYWPGAIRDGSIEALVSTFEAINYEICANGDQEPGYEKVALYVDEHAEWTHAAKQENDGSWSSKLGDSWDIRHQSEHQVSGPLYGQVIYYMRRSLATPPPPHPAVIRRQTPRGRKGRRRESGS